MRALTPPNDTLRSRRLRGSVAAVVALLVVALTTHALPAEADAPSIANEFDTAADQTRALQVWTIQTGAGGWGNNELQRYTWDSVGMSGGALTITAQIPRNGGTPTSGRMTTQGKWSFLYGTLEARITLPSGKGLLPAFWLMGDNLATVGWPRCGEIDVVEMPFAAPTAVSGMHGPTSTGAEWKSAATMPISPGAHVYSVEKKPGAVTLRIDGTVIFHATKAQAQSAGVVWPFDQPTHALFSLAVGGNWPGNPDATTPTTARMYVDWIHYTPWS